MKKYCIVLLTICCILLTTACNDKNTVNSDIKNTSCTSSEAEVNESINSQETSVTMTETTETSSEKNAESTVAIESKPTQESKPAHQHDYVSTVTEGATCVSTGTKKYQCSCGASYTETVAKTSHSYSSATCTSAKKCTVCGATSGEALGHNYSNGYCTQCNTADPTPKQTLNVPSLPLSAKYVCAGELYSIVKITDISYEFDNSTHLTVYITGEKVYDYEGNSGDMIVCATLKLYDSEGYVVGDTFIGVQELKVGEKFRNEFVGFDIPEDCTSFTLEITDRD